MTTQMRISKLVIAALLGGGVLVGSLMVPNGSHAQTVGGPASFNITVAEKGKKQVIDCDVKIDVQNLPPGQTAEFTTTEGRRYQLKPGINCLKNGVMVAAGGQGPPIVVPASNPGGGCTTTAGPTPQTICH